MLFLWGKKKKKNLMSRWVWVWVCVNSCLSSYQDCRRGFPTYSRRWSVTSPPPPPHSLVNRLTPFVFCFFFFLFSFSRNFNYFYFMVFVFCSKAISFAPNINCDILFVKPLVIYIYMFSSPICELNFGSSK